MFKSTWRVIFLCLFALPTVSARELIIISDPFPPWQFEAADGSIKGINIDILNRIAKKLDVKLVYKHQPWTRAWLSIKRGTGDAVISASRKKSREPYLRFPKLGTDLWVSRYVFFTHEQRKLEIDGSYKAVLDNQQSVCIVNGFSYHQSFWQAFPYANIKQGEKLSQYTPDRRDYHPLIVSASESKVCFKLLLKNRVDVVIADLSIGLTEIKKLKNNSESEKMASGLTHYDKVLFSKGYPLSFVKNSNYPQLEVLGERFWAELLAMQASGEYQVIVDRWLK
ncbi:MAG: transporter substrate-binding domain-containing protein [Oceanospirillaceae bacterium]|nr:transporter substrate-binding domain-containing protein [Oceanospirillaceae bacterium]